MLGGGGMLGHKVVQALSGKYRDTWWTLRGGRPSPFLPLDRCIEGVDVSDWSAFQALLDKVRPDVIVNCLGIIKQRAEAQSPIASLTVNALLPHRLAEAAAVRAGRLIHFSTDCVFSGRKGGYTEADVSDAEDLYGRTKFLGEVAGPNALTLRTSIIGREVKHHQSLLDWFLLGSHTKVPGYRCVWWSGITTNHLAGLVADLIDRHPTLNGLYQVSSGRISKYDLLCMLRDAFDIPVEVEPDDGPVNDRTLDGSRFAAAVGYRCPPWEELIGELVNDSTPYERLPQRARHEGT